MTLPLCCPRRTPPPPPLPPRESVTSPVFRRTRATRRPFVLCTSTGAARPVAPSAMNCMLVVLELTPLMLVEEELTAKGGPHRTGPPSAATTRGSLSTNSAASSCTCALAAAALRICPATACKPAPKRAPAVRPSRPSPKTGFSSADMSGSRSLRMRCGGGSSFFTRAFGKTFLTAALRVAIPQVSARRCNAASQRKRCAGSSVHARRGACKQSSAAKARATGKRLSAAPRQVLGVRQQLAPGLIAAAVASALVALRGETAQRHARRRKARMRGAQARCAQRGARARPRHERQRAAMKRGCERWQCSRAHVG